ncbi:hypothetical protein HOI18_00420 [Candidatus Uhrbacteria bacterium]|nr:hypothetical protein [Candidatus Uhrbacteria bacterium]
MLPFVLKFIGWIFTVVPVLAFVGVSVVVIKGAANDDGLIMSLVMLGILLFVMGVIILSTVYLSGIFG